MTQNFSSQAGNCGACNITNPPPEPDYEQKSNILSMRANVMKKNHDTIHLYPLDQNQFIMIKDGFVTTATATDSSIKQIIKQIASELSPNSSANTDCSLLLPNGTEKLFCVNNLNHI